LLFLVPAISQTHKSLDNSQDFFVKTKTKTKTFTSRPRPRPRPRLWVSRPRPRPRPRLYFFVLEAPRDQDFGLEDYITGLMMSRPYRVLAILSRHTGLVRRTTFCDISGFVGGLRSTECRSALYCVL